MPLESELDSYNDDMPLSPFESAYVAVQSYSDTPSTSTDQMNVIRDESYSISISTVTSFPDPFQHVFATDEGIREILSVDELPWDDLHHQYYFFPDLDKLENNFSSIFTIDYVKEPQNPTLITHLESETNLGNISTIVPIDISIKPRIIENIHIGASCSMEDINTYKALFQEF